MTSIIIAGRVGVLLLMFLFCRSFLLTRSALPDTSYGPGTGPDRPLPAPPRLVLFLIDSLRYSAWPRIRPSSPAPVFTRRFVADAPTVTMQRLKALLTGGLPTFIEAGAAFSGARLVEDNLVGQLLGAGRKVVFAGDDTWCTLVDCAGFLHATPMESFNVADLDGVDEGVWGAIRRESRNGDWDVLILHTLGVDHIGHMIGSEGPRMRAKEAQMREMIKDLILGLQEATARDDAREVVLMVFGDHGMTKDGNHGGATEAETDSVLATYRFPAKPGAGQDQGLPAVMQTDLTPSLAVLAGIPIPYSNLGQVMTGLLPPEAEAEALEANALQVSRYVTRYFGDADGGVSLQRASGEPAREYLTRAARSCRARWTTFDETGMLVALLGLVGTTIWLLVHHPLPWPMLALGFAHAALPLSNSFIISESSISVFMACTSLVTGAPSSKNRWMGAAALRLASLALVPRSDDPASFSTTTTTTTTTTFATASSLAAAPFLVAVWLFFVSSSRDIDRPPPRGRWGRLALFSLPLIGQAACVSAFWAVGSQHVWLPRVTYLTSLAVAVFRRELALPSMALSAMLLVGPRQAWSLPLTVSALASALASPSPLGPAADGVTLHLIGSSAFFLTGRECQFSKIDFSSAFVGFDEYHVAVGAIAVTAGTFCGPLLAGYLQNGRRAKAHITMHLAALSGAALMAFIHKRHLMVWAIFAPKFVFTVANCVLALVFTSLS
jgi:hypothetical protein